MAAQAGGPRPDPALGVFETLLVVAGRPVELEAHLARLDASLRALFGAPAPAAAGELMRDHARELDLGRLRLTVAPAAGGRLASDVRAAPVDEALLFPGPERGVVLASIVVAGGIGAHKWADRRLLERAEADLGGPLALIVDRDGSALEASRGNLLAVFDGILVAPPTDGRILPGVTRGRVLELAAALGIPVREEPVPLDRLRAADEVLITGAVRGIEPVRACDGEACGSSETPIGSRLAGELQRAWALRGRTT
jgi:para-aminobenzoate synthetase/4-amino-4-deoxychorismate lyase